MSKLTSFYRQANKDKTTCKVCHSQLGIKCVRTPSEKHPNVIFEIKPCTVCNKKKQKKKFKTKILSNPYYSQLHKNVIEI